VYLNYVGQFNPVDAVVHGKSVVVVRAVREKFFLGYDDAD